jgi:hypothetical protein
MDEQAREFARGSTATSKSALPISPPTPKISPTAFPTAPPNCAAKPAASAIWSSASAKPSASRQTPFRHAGCQRSRFHRPGRGLAARLEKETGAISNRMGETETRAGLKPGYRRTKTSTMRCPRLPMPSGNRRKSGDRTGSLGDALDQKAAAIVQRLVEAEQAMDVRATSVHSTLDERTRELNSMLASRSAELSRVIDEQARPLVDQYASSGEEFANRLTEVTQTRPIACVPKTPP